MTPRQLSCGVIIPLYNKGSSIARCIDSILGQTSPVDEIIVVNDGSTDDSRDVAARIDDPRIIVMDQANAGPGAARNAGGHAATSDLLTFLDADDAWKPQFIAQARESFSRNPDQAAYVCGFDTGAYRDVRPNLVAALERKGLRRLTPADTPGQVVEMIHAMHSSATVVRRSEFERSGGFYAADRCLFGEDSYFWIQVLFAGEVYWDEAELCHYHIEDSELGFAVTRRKIATPISRHLAAGQGAVREELRPLWNEVIALWVGHDLKRLGDSGSFRAARELRRMHQRPAGGVIIDGLRYSRSLLRSLRS